MKHWTGLVATFDAKSRNRFVSLQENLQASPQVTGKYHSDTPPHITLFSHQEIRTHKLYHLLAEFSRDFPVFELEFSSFAYFPSTKVFYLNPKYNITLQELRDRCIGCALKADIQLHTGMYETWNPHSTILTDLSVEELNFAVSVSQKSINLQLNNPFKVVVSHLEIFSYPPYKTERIFHLLLDL